MFVYNRYACISGEMRKVAFFAWWFYAKTVRSAYIRAYRQILN